jgi:hypothetical protein
MVAFASASIILQTVEGDDAAQAGRRQPRRIAKTRSAAFDRGTIP